MHYFLPPPSPPPLLSTTTTQPLRPPSKASNGDREYSCFYGAELAALPATQASKIAVSSAASKLLGHRYAQLPYFLLSSYSSTPRFHLVLVRGNNGIVDCCKAGLRALEFPGNLLVLLVFFQDVGCTCTFQTLVSFLINPSKKQRLWVTLIIPARP